MGERDWADEKARELFPNAEEMPLSFVAAMLRVGHEVGLADGEARGRVAGLREALSLSESQRIPWDLAKSDDYRRGQYRGANDCVSIIRRSVDGAAPAQPPPTNCPDDGHQPDECPTGQCREDSPAAPPPTREVPRCIRCGAAYDENGACVNRKDGCQGGRGEWPGPTPPAAPPAEQGACEECKGTGRDPICFDGIVPARCLACGGTGRKR